LESIICDFEDPAMFSQRHIDHDKKRPEIFRGKHLIVLQHGFLGNSYDMRLLAQAIELLCPSNVQV
jgi:hypothetical protein